MILSKTIDFITFPDDGAVNKMIHLLGGKCVKGLITENMGILFHPVDLLKRMQTTFTARIVASDLRGGHYDLFLFIDDEACILSITDYLVSVKKVFPEELDSVKARFTDDCVIECTRREFCTIFLGYVPVDDILDAQFSKIREDYQKLVKILFPVLDPVWECF